MTMSNPETRSINNTKNKCKETGSVGAERSRSGNNLGGRHKAAGCLGTGTKCDQGTHVNKAISS